MKPATSSKTAEDTARSLARSQCTESEVVAALMVRHGMSRGAAAALIEENSESLTAYQLDGRAMLREFLFKAATGDYAVAKTATNTSITAAALLGRQHLGYDLSDRIRKLIEHVESHGSSGKHKAKLVTLLQQIAGDSE